MYIINTAWTNLCMRVFLGQICGVCSNLVSNHTSLHIIAVGQAKMLLGSDIAEQRCAKGADVGCTDSRSDVVVARSNVGCQWTQGVEGRFATPIQLLLHVFGDFVQRNVARSLIHHLDVFLPCSPSQLTFRFTKTTSNPEFVPTLTVQTCMHGARESHWHIFLIEKMKNKRSSSRDHVNHKLSIAQSQKTLRSAKWVWWLLELAISFQISWEEIPISNNTCTQM